MCLSIERGQTTGDGKCDVRTPRYALETVNFSYTINQSSSAPFIRPGAQAFTENLQL